MKDLGNDFSGFPSNHSLKHKMMKRISPQHHQLYKDKINNTHDSDQLVKLFHVAKQRGHVIDEGVVDTVKKGAKKAWDYATEPIHQAHDIIAKDRAKNIAKIRKNKEQDVKEGADERSQNALWAQITQHEKQAKATKNDIKKQHHMKMADELRSKLKTNDLEEGIDAILADLEEGGNQGPTSKKVCLSNVSDEALGVSQLASCKSQGLRARDGKKSHLIGHGSSKVRITVGGKKIKGKAHGGPLPDYGTRKGQ